MKNVWLVCFVAVAFSLPVIGQSSTAGPACSLNFVSFNPSGVSVRVQNTSGKTIVGLTFYAAIADATEHWKWYRWNFDETKPLREFGWNKQIKPGASKTLSWDRSDLDFEHGGGGAFVATAILFEDGTSWEESPDGAGCRALWLNNHKKVFTRPIDLPRRP